MKRIWIPIIALAAFGCGKSDTVVLDNKGNKVTVEKDGTVTATTPDGTKTTIKTEDGKTTYADSKGRETTVDAKEGLTSTDEDGTKYATAAAAKITEEDLGLPFYPGSTEDLSGSYRADSTEKLLVGSLRRTTVPVSKVAEFYRPKIKNVTEATSKSNGSQGTNLVGELEDGSKIGVVINSEPGKGETVINIARSKKK